MLRRRDIAASPARRADEAWSTIVGLLSDTLNRSPEIDGSDVRTALAGLAHVGPRLVAGRHLEEDPVVLVAEPVRLSVYTVSGADAVTLEENLAPVPGGASATGWTLYVPAAEPLTAEVIAAVDACEHVTSDTPPSAVVKASAADVIDVDALTRHLDGDLG